MTTGTPGPMIAAGRRRLLRLILAGAAALALLALYTAAQPQAAETPVGSGSVRPTDSAIAPQAPPVLIGGGFAADDDDDQARLQQSMQQAQEQNDEAEQQFNQDMQQQQTYENQFSNP